MEDREMTKLKNMFNNKLESIRTNYENEIKSQIDSSLNKIYEKVTEDIQKAVD
jgi:BMFP domain-containing protein YqiC